MAEFDPVSIIEAAYRLAVPGETWMKGILEVVRPQWDDGLGVGMFEMALDEQGRPTIGTSFFDSDEPDLFAEMVSKMTLSVDDQQLEHAFCKPMICATISERMAPVYPDFRDDPIYQEFGHPIGMYDCLGVRVADPSGTMVLMLAPLSEISTTDPAQRHHWARLAAHVAAAYRLRREQGARPVEPDEADAVLSADGKVEHLAEAALKDDEISLERLEAAAEAIGRARGELRHSAPADAVELWKTLVQARYSVLEHVDTDGKKMLIARRNEAATGEPLSLSPRERHVVQFAAMGHSDRLIAYELGLSNSDVEQLLASGLEKLQFESRGELLRLWQRVQR